MKFGYDATIMIISDWRWQVHAQFIFLLCCFFTLLVLVFVVILESLGGNRFVMEGDMDQVCTLPWGNIELVAGTEHVFWCSHHC